MQTIKDDLAEVQKKHDWLAYAGGAIELGMQGKPFAIDLTDGVGQARGRLAAEVIASFEGMYQQRELALPVGSVKHDQRLHLILCYVDAKATMMAATT